jgi:4-diphosphocytidyl-2-C-methyl-D-erythritol kinase
MSQSGSSVAYRAYGKVNLALSVMGRRRDGYHEVSTVMAAINLFDQITVERRPAGVSVYCPDLPSLPQEQNLAYRAAREYLSKNTPRGGVFVGIDKGIPVGGGMGGGSSDAAATLLAMNDVFGMKGASPESTSDCLHLMARTLGADVPFFLGPNASPSKWTAAICAGIGDIVTPVEANSFWLVLLLLTEGVRTPWAFAVWDMDNPAKGPPVLPVRDDRPLTVAKELRFGTAESLAEVVYNDLEEPLMARRGDIAEAKEALLRAGALNAAMTGSGSTVYGICRSKEHALLVREKMLSRKTAFLIDAKVVRTGVT